MNRTKEQLARRSSRAWQDAGDFRASVRTWSEKLGVNPSQIRLQHMTRKWASCSPGGIISFNTDLVREDRQFGEAVIVHELLHLKVPNHGPLFRSLLKVYMPGWESLVPDGETKV